MKIDRQRTWGGLRRGVCAAALWAAAGTAAWCAEPLVTLSTTQIAFADQAQNTTSGGQPIILSNSGGAELTIQSISITGQNASDFGHTTTCPATPAVLAAGAQCEIVVVCRPHTTGPLSATLTIADSASGSPRSVTIVGNGTAEAPTAAISPGSLSFGNQAEATVSAARTVTVTNSGSAVLNINSGISIGGTASNEFRLQRLPNSCPEASGQLPARASCVIAVVFAPATIGGKSAQITIVDDAAGSPHVIALSGMGVAAQNP